MSAYTRNMQRAIMVENHCTQAHCTDMLGENCVCTADLMGTFAIVLDPDAQGIEARAALQETPDAA